MRATAIRIVQFAMLLLVAAPAVVDAQQNTTVVQESTGAGASAPAATVGAGVPLKMVGGGARTNWSGNGNLLTQTQPGAPGQNTWIGSGKDHLAASPATLTAYGVGLADPNDDWDVGVFLQTSALAAHPVATASLPAGFALTGGGCLVDWRASPSPMGNLLTASFPSSLTTWECRSKDHSVSSPAPITAFVVGIRPKKAGIALPTVQITTTTSAVTNHPTAVAPALPGWVVTGGGARALPANTAGAGQLLTGTFPTTAQGSQIPTGWYAASKDHAVASPGTVQAFAVNLQFASSTVMVIQPASVFAALPVRANPAGLTAVHRGGGRVELQWPAVQGAVQYRVDGTGVPAAGILSTGINATVTGVPGGPGSWGVVAIHPNNLLGNGPVPRATAVVRVLPPHSQQWLTKNNGAGTFSQVQTPYRSCGSGTISLAQSFNAQYSEWLGQDSYNDESGNSCWNVMWSRIPVDQRPDSVKYGPTTIPFGLKQWLGITMPLWDDPAAAANEAVYGNSGDLGVGRRTACEQMLVGVGTFNAVKVVRTICYATAHGSVPGTLGTPAFNDPQIITRPGAGMGSDFILAMLIVKDPSGSVFLVLGKNGKYKLEPYVGLDTEGQKLVPFACLSCHGGTYNPQTRKVDGASLLPLDPGLLVFASPADQAAQEEKFRSINSMIVRSDPTSAIAAYIRGLYSGAMDQPGARAQPDYVPAGWAPQAGLYRQVVKPYCAMCHLAAPNQMNFASWSNFEAYKGLINASVCGPAHTMPHSELQFKAFWTKDTGALYVPGLLSTTLGYSSC